MGKYIDLTNQKIGKLLVLERTPESKGSKAIFKCRCECGTERTIGSYYLRTHGENASCGCIVERNNRIHTSSREATINCIISGYKIGAKKRNLVWELSRNEIIILLSSNCYYCGTKPAQIRNAYISLIKNTKTNYARKWREDAEVIINGIDRLDNSQGYTTDNCVSCCKQCNAAKSDMLLVDFEAWISKLVKKYLEKLR